MISMAYLLRFPERIKGVIAQSGYLPARETLQIDAKQVAGKPVIMTHGFEDPRIAGVVAKDARPASGPGCRSDLSQFSYGP